MGQKLNHCAKTDITIDGKGLRFDEVAAVAFSQPGMVTVGLSPEAEAVMLESASYLAKVSRKRTLYGINTGFGVLSDKKIPHDQLDQLQINLVRSHCVGVGKPFSIPITRGMMLLRANCLCSGYSGINPAPVKLLCDFLSHGITPKVPEKGSVGASGDLAPLAHVARCLVGEGTVFFADREMPTLQALEKISQKPVRLGPKEGLALLNGTAAMASLGILAIIESQKLFKLADIAAALTLDGMAGTNRAYDKKISQIRPHPGQVSTAGNLNRLLKGSGILQGHKDCDRVQDAYSLRCVPQIHGASRQTLKQAEDVFSVELNAVTDNPLIFFKEDDVISGGNFHGQPLALAMDYLSMGLAELCSVSERRIEKMMNPVFSQLPAFLNQKAGLNSGLMMAQVTAAALASENKYLCHPASVDTIPTSTDKEDHVSMGVSAGRKLHEVIFNVKHTLAIEFLCNCQAIELRRPLKSSPAIEAVVKKIREKVPFVSDDRALDEDIKNIVDLMERDEILNEVVRHIGELA